MKLSLRLILLFLISGFFLYFGAPKQATAGDQRSVISPYLHSVLSKTPENTKVDVYLVMQDRLSYRQLEGQVRGMKRKARQAAVAQILKKHAETSQRQILAHLREAESRGIVKNIRIIWILNGISFRGSADAIYDLSNRSDGIEGIFYDAKFPIDALLDDNGISKSNREHGQFISKGINGIQPGLTLINAPMVWAEGDSGQGVIVANIDTGTDWHHPDLIHNVWNNLGEDADGDGHTLEQSGSSWIFDPGDVNGVDDDGNGRIDDFIGWDFDTDDNDPDDSYGHGTSTSGQVAGDGTNGTQTGVAPRAKLMLLKDETAGESGYWLAEQYAVANGADIITSSLSFKWYFSPQPNYPMFRQVTDMELAAGVVHTNSTSNDGNSTGIPFNISAPGNCPSPWIHPDQTLTGGVSSVIGVGNVTVSTDIIASSSPWGPTSWEDYQANHPAFPYIMPIEYQDYPYETVSGAMGLIKPDVSAPGNGTTSTVIGGGYSGFSGTSSATPHTGGTVALILSANPDLLPADVSRILQTTAVEKGDPGKDNRYGAGRIDAYAAYLQAFMEAGTPDSPRNLSAYSDYTIPNSMELTWEDPSLLLNGDTLLAGEFHIHIARDGIPIDSVAGGVQHYTDFGLVDGTEYHYSVTSKVDSSKRESAAAKAAWIAGGSPVPSIPGEVGIASIGGQVMFRWRNPAKNIDGTPLDDLAGINLYLDSVFVETFTRSSADSGMADSAYFANPPAGFHQWFITAIDNENPQNESGPSLTVVTPQNAPLGDNFAIVGPPNPLVWRNDDADVNDRALDPPSGSFALNLNGKPDGGDVVELYPIDLSSLQGSGVVFSYFYQPQGQGNAPETGDSLQLYFRNDLGDYVLIRSYSGGSVQPFQHEIIDLATAPNGGGDYFHSQFQVLFRSIGSSSAINPNDDWFVDDVYLGTPAPYITTSASSVVFDTTIVDSTSLFELEISNLGMNNLTVTDVVSTNSMFAVNPTNFVVSGNSGELVSISFTPTQVGLHTGLIRFVSDDPAHDTLDVAVSGLGDVATGVGEKLSVPTVFSVSQNYPNPFNPTTQIYYQLPRASDVELVIYNLLGQEVRRLVETRAAAGRYSVTWDGLNETGNPVASGIYLYRFRAGDYSRVMKMILMK